MSLISYTVYSITFIFISADLLAERCQSHVLSWHQTFTLWYGALTCCIGNGNCGKLWPEECFCFHQLLLSDLDSLVRWCLNCRHSHHSTGTSATVATTDATLLHGFIFCCWFQIPTYHLNLNSSDQFFQPPKDSVSLWSLQSQTLMSYFSDVLIPI